MEKAVAYVTWEGRLLLFRAVEAPWAGAELPGGTLEPGERPEAAVVREVGEEMGLGDLGPPVPLATVDHEPGDGLEIVASKRYRLNGSSGHKPERFGTEAKSNVRLVCENEYWVRSATDNQTRTRPLRQDSQYDRGHSPTIKVLAAWVVLNEPQPE